MNREIKFRVWDAVDYMSSSFTLMDLMLGKIEFTEDCIVMQFTGLKDKNEKEIYEGDIVRLSEDFHFKSYELCVIEWHKHRIPYIVQRYLVNPPEYGDYNFDFLKDSSISGVDSYYEVIGNIYQNPELLKSNMSTSWPYVNTSTSPIVMKISNFSKRMKFILENKFSYSSNTLIMLHNKQFRKEWNEMFWIGVTISASCCFIAILVFIRIHEFIKIKYH